MCRPDAFPEPITGIAAALRESRPDVAREALRRLLDIAPQLDNVTRQAQYIAKAARQALDMHDTDLVQKAVRTGMDLAANLKATRNVVRRALAVYAISPQGDGKLTLDSYLGDASRGNEKVVEK